MTYDDFNRFCAALPATSHVVQWGGSHVWKVGGKMFAVGGWDEAVPAFTFKVSPTSFEILKALPGLRPAPYLASRGMSWIQHYAEPGLGDAEARFGIMLNPAHAARSEIGRGPQAGERFQDLERSRTDLEGESGDGFVPSADREHLTANLPHMRSAPLHDMARRGQGGAEAIEVVVGHARASHPAEVLRDREDILVAAPTEIQ